MEEEIKLLSKASHKEATSKWKRIVAEYQKPSVARASWQVANSIGPYFALWGLWMYMSLGLSLSYWWAIPPALLAGMFMVRVFIIFHDCGHGSFYKSKKANNYLGFISGLLIFTPYFHWRWEHSVHHATSGDLDRRGIGDIWTLTVREYLDSSRWKKFSYRLVRSPFVLFLLAPISLFLVLERFPSKRAGPREKRSVWLMNFALLAAAAGLISILGFLPWLVFQLAALVMASSCGVWMFYVQHQFEETYWSDSEDWDYTTAAIQGSSFYQLPRVLQWFSGNIGFHHIHHLSPKIPNYNLEKCHWSDPMFQEVKAMTLWGSLKSINSRLWDEDSKKMIGFRQLKKQLREEKADLAETMSRKAA
ncbi:MAG: fatty acid desaturase [Verrucomicrobia bacterium]|jgi:omega-6 fatty acid desaturase (delta-12 desaturase)|nr:fatty acid desaturase [Verrucomicrobiota bacterium]MDA1047740.1 fatty acid desaturase [Verrucomicrobiota bacterium]